MARDFIQTRDKGFIIVGSDLFHVDDNQTLMKAYAIRLDSNWSTIWEFKVDSNGSSCLFKL